VEIFPWNKPLPESCCAEVKIIPAIARLHPAVLKLKIRLSFSGIPFLLRRR